jgi:hypothetical protein
MARDQNRTPDEVFSRPREWEEIPRGRAMSSAWREPIVVAVFGSATWLEETGVAAALTDVVHPAARFFRIRRPLPEIAHLPIEEGAAQNENAVVDEEAWVEFVFQYPDGSAVKDLDYVLTKPDHSTEPGKLPGSGKVTKRPTPAGTYSLALKEVDTAYWEQQRRNCDDELKVIARTSGYPDGTAAQVKLYRELTESEGDELDTVDAEITADRIEATFTFDYSGDDLKDQTGTIALIAEVSVDGGKSWAKTQRPLELALKNIQHVRWSRLRAEHGDVVELRVETAGYPPSGTNVSIELWKLDWVEGDTKVTDIGPLPLTGRNAVARIAYGASGADATIDDCGEYYAIAKIEDSVTRTNRSDLVWCVYQDVEEEDSGADAAA